jgi:hypothetical protein
MSARGLITTTLEAVPVDRHAHARAALLAPAQCAGPAYRAFEITSLLTPRHISCGIDSPPTAFSATSPDSLHIRTNRLVSKDATQRFQRL